MSEQVFTTMANMIGGVERRDYAPGSEETTVAIHCGH
jgi:hypothetical protein